MFAALAWIGARAAEGVPALEPLMLEDRWRLVRPLSSYPAGLVFRESPFELRILDCFEAQPTVSFPTTELVEKLQAGVRIDLGGGFVATVAFGPVSQRALPAEALVPTAACREELLWAWLWGLDLARTYVVHEVLEAPVTAKGCERRDARGRFRPLDLAELASAPLCARLDAESVTLGYRLTPLSELPGLLEPQLHGARLLPEEEITLEMYRRALEEDYVICQLAPQKRLESIERLEGLLADAAPERRAELMLRLADLYFSHGISLQEGAQPWLEEALGLYEALLRDHPRYERIDQAQFFLAMSLQRLGRPEQAAEVFGQLVRLHPNSEYIVDACVYLAELLQQTDPRRALRAYELASRYPSSPLYGYAMYKIAWGHHLAGERDLALAALHALAAYLHERGHQSPYGLLRRAVYSALTRF
jgi:tetratricopeptide (TPR) repeat protein